MTQPVFSRRQFSLAIPSLVPLLGISRYLPSRRGEVPGDQEISRTEEAIHQEVVLNASRQRVYAALTETEQFRKVSNGLETQISKEPGGAFSLFGKAISGRHVELVPGERLVQAWRSEGWAASHYSIVRFDLKEQGAQTKVVFDHTGFPKGQAEHLAGGWKQHYWEPLAQYFKA